MEMAILRNTTAKNIESRNAEMRVSIWYRSVCALTIASGLYFIWANRFLPMQDYPDWLYQGYLFSKFLIGHPLPEYSIKTYPIPDATVTVLIGLLNFVASPEASGKIALSLFLCSFVAASVYLFKSLNPSEDNLLLYLPLVLAVNNWLLIGNISYYFALATLFLFFGYVIRRLEDLRMVNALITLILMTVLFFTHFIPYLEACVFSAILFLHQRNTATLRKLIVPALVSGLLVIWYSVARLHSGELTGKVWEWWPDLHTMVGGAIYPFFLFWNFLPFQSLDGAGRLVAASLNLLWLLVTVAIAIVAARFALSESSEGKARSVIYASAAYGVLFVVTGFRFALGNIGERFLYPALWLACCWLGSQRSFVFTVSANWIPKVIVTGLIVTQCLWLNYTVSGVSTQLNGVFTELKAAKKQSTQQFCDVYENYYHRSEPAHHRPIMQILLPSIQPVLRLPYYLYIEDDAEAPVFPTGLLGFNGKGNYDNLCE